MESLQQKDKQKYVKGITLNSVFILIALWFALLVVYPKYTALSEVVAESNTLSSEMDRIKNQGMSIEELALASKKTKNSLSKEVFADKDKLNEILKKPSSFQGNYISWIAEEIGTIDAVNTEIDRNNAIIGNIIPTFTNISADKDDDLGKNRVTLKSFIDYIETQILKKYSLESFSALGINNISFDENRASTVNIGSFKVPLDIEGKNSNILDLVESIQKSGKLVIQEGNILSAVPDKPSSSTTSLSELNNLLISIDAMQFSEMLERNEKRNKGSMTLRFYIKGINYQEFLVIRGSIFERIETLSKNVKKNGGLCVKWGAPLCKDSAGNSAASAIKSLNADVSALQSRILEMKKNNSVIDMWKEMENLVALSSSLQSLESQYNKHIAVIDKLK